MKRIVLCLIAVLFAVVAIAQDKKEMRLDLNNGTSITGKVQIQIDGSYLIETPSGDLFLFSPSEVNKAIIIGNSVKRGTNGKTVYKKGGRLLFSDTGVPLTETDFTSFRDWDKYQSARALRSTGNILMLSAAGCVGVGLGISFWYVDDIPFILSAIGGGALLGSGLICTIIGNAKINSIGKKYNQHPGYAIDFGAQEHGIGFAINF